MNCQLQCIDEICEENTWLDEILQYPIIIYRLSIHVWKRILPGAKTTYSNLLPNQDNIKPGDTIRIRSKAEIKRTLDRFNRTRGCAFQNRMYPYCGKECKVFKKVDYFFDESRRKFCKCNNIFLLEGCHCDGSTTPLKACDRNCFYFWHASWLEKI
jgi:hypothetical protein